MMMALPQKPWFLAVGSITLIAGFLLISSFIKSTDHTLLCSSIPSTTSSLSTTSQTSDLTSIILHYATSSITPQQSRAEIKISYKVLQSKSPCNFLVFGLGHDSPMWHSFNTGGTTIFLEEDPKWVNSVLKDSPMLSAFHVKYPTQLQQADELVKIWKTEPACSPLVNKGLNDLKGNRECRLALADLPEEVYEKEWDLIMIDAPRGYFNEAPGRMGAIYSAAVMARGRKAEGDTHVFLHDVDRRVEKMFAMEFLCKKYLVEGKGRLWHFRIPAVRGKATEEFC